MTWKLNVLVFMLLITMYVSSIILPDQMLGRGVTYFHHHKINPLIQKLRILKVDTECKRVKLHLIHSHQHQAENLMLFPTCSLFSCLYHARTEPCRME